MTQLKSKKIKTTQLNQLKNKIQPVNSAEKTTFQKTQNYMKTETFRQN